MKFFIPLAKDSEQAEQVYQAVRKNINSTGPIFDRRIFAITYKIGRTTIRAEVGEAIDFARGPVIAIYESVGIYYVCSAFVGAAYGSPELVATKDVSQIEYFEP